MAANTDLADYTDGELTHMLAVVHERQETALDDLTATFIACSMVADQVLDEMNRRKEAAL